MDDHPSVEQIRAAVDRSGYLMEQKITAGVSIKGYSVVPSWPFPDQDLGVSREVDVLGNKSIHMEEKPPFAFLWLLCECKNSSQPFVFMGNSRDEWHGIWLSSLVNVAGKDSSAKWKAISSKIDISKHHHYSPQAVLATQFCKIVRDRSAWKANHEGVYDSLLLPLIKAVEAHKSITEGFPALIPFTISVYYLVIVTAGDLYYLDAASPDSQPEKKEWCSLYRRINSSKITGAYTFDFVTMDHLGKFLDTVIEPSRLEINRAICEWELDAIAHGETR